MGFLRHLLLSYIVAIIPPYYRRKLLLAALLKDAVSERGSDKVLVKANRVFHLARYKSVVRASGYIGSWLINTDDTLHYTLSEFKHCRNNSETDSLAERLLADVPSQLHYASLPLMYRDFATAARLLPTT